MKKGITTATIILAVVIMFILVTSTAAIGSNAIRTVNYEEYISKIKRVSDSVNEYMTKNDELPTTGVVISKADLDDDFSAELTANNDEDSNLFIVDMVKIKVTGVNIGKGTVEDRNNFLVSEDTGNVYYYKGYKYKEMRYYGI